MIKTGQVFTGVSSKIIMYFESRTNWPGFSARLDFIQDPKCE